MFKKIEFHKVAFDQTEDGHLVIVLEDNQGNSGRVTIGEDGFTVRP